MLKSLNMDDRGAMPGVVGKPFKHGLFWILLLAASWGGVFTQFTVAWAQEKTSNQVWASFVLGFKKSDRLYLEVNVAPKAQITGIERWRNLDVTGLVEYTPSKWFDLTGQLLTGYTEQINDLSSLEVTTRIGILLHLVEELIKKCTQNRKLGSESSLPLERFSWETWLRLEWRNFFYFGDLETSHELRLRIRPGFMAALNNPSLSDDNTLYLRSDLEFYIPLNGEVSERFVTQIRFRGGLGYRIDPWMRVELLYMRDVNRASPLGDFEENTNMLDLRLIFLF